MKIWVRIPILEHCEPWNFEIKNWIWLDRKTANLNSNYWKKNKIGWWKYASSSIFQWRRKVYLVRMLGINNSDSVTIFSCLVTIINPFPYIRCGLRVYDPHQRYKRNYFLSIYINWEAYSKSFFKKKISYYINNIFIFYKRRLMNKRRFSKFKSFIHVNGGS